jgi:flagellum-specific ATP synthase
VRALITRYEQKRDIVELDALRPGGDPLLDAAVARMPRIERFLQQDLHDMTAYDDMLAQLVALG